MIDLKVTTKNPDHLNVTAETKHLLQRQFRLTGCVQWFGYFVLLLILAMPSGLKSRFVFPWSLNSSPLTICPRSTVKDIIRDFTPTDLATYADGALLIAHTGTKDKELLALLPPGYFSYSAAALDEMFAHWPPGFFFLQAGILKLIGTNGPFILCLMIATCTVWSFVLWNLYLLARSKLHGIIGYPAPLIICLSGIFHYYFLRIGVLNSEPISIGLMCLSFLFLVRSSLEQNKTLAIISGILLALSAYVRAQTEIFAVFLTLFVIGTALFYFCQYKFLPSQNSIFPRIKKPINLLLFALLAFHCCTMPYRLYNLQKFHTASWLRLDSYWRLAWLDRNKTNPDRSGITIAAQLNPSLRKEIESKTAIYGDQYYSNKFYKQSTINTFLQYPYQWIYLKSCLIPYLWFWPPYRCPDACSLLLADIENYCHMTFLVLSAILIFASLKQKHWQSTNIIYLFLFLSLLSSSLMTSILIHIEPRYFFILKFGTLIILFAFLCTNSSTSEITNTKQKSPVSQ